jgi:hypothetical protein
VKLADLLSTAKRAGFNFGSIVMAEVHSAEDQWLPVIRKALAYLCLRDAQKKEGDMK